MKKIIFVSMFLSALLFACKTLEKKTTDSAENEAVVEKTENPENAEEVKEEVKESETEENEEVVEKTENQNNTDETKDEKKESKIEEQAAITPEEKIEEVEINPAEEIVVMVGCDKKKVEKSDDGKIIIKKNPMGLVLEGKYTNCKSTTLQEIPKVFDRIKNIPRDKYGLINWVALLEEGFIAPKPTITPDPDFEEEFFDAKILFESKGDFKYDVIYPHDIHTWWLTCEICHETKGEEPIFEQAAGANPVLMTEITKGKYCGRCHGKVAFPLKDCKRCHSVTKDDPRDDDLIIREIDY